MNTTSPIISKQTIKFDGIQILRGLAASMVVFCHYSMAIASYYPNKQLLSKFIFSQWGGGGVDIFFVISGFIMYYTTIGKEWSLTSAKSFLLKRSLRIYPLYWLFTMLILIIVITHLGLKDTKLTTPYLFTSFSLMPYPKPGYPLSFHPLLDQGWTLTYEMYFYLVFSIAILARQKNILYCLSVGFLGLAGIGLLLSDFFPAITHLLTSPLIVEFILGIVVAKFLLTLKDAFDSSFFSNHYIKILLIASMLILFFFTAHLTQNYYLRALIWGPAAAVIVFSGATFSKTHSTFARFLIFLGNASYSIYLSHSFFSIFIATLLKKGYLHQFSPNLIIVLSTVGTILLCSLVYLTIEKPLNKILKDFFITPPKPGVE